MPSVITTDTVSVHIFKDFITVHGVKYIRTTGYHASVNEFLERPQRHLITELATKIDSYN